VKIQIARLSPHQNAKVFAVLMAVATLVFAITMFFMFLYMPPGVDARGNPVNPPPAWIVLFFPLVYLVIGYVMVAIGCWFYNLMVKYIGGIEYETREQ
jgi:NADH:ubiquinone oxidoreductase subunit 5 (subunit L)/multisubunit Na+/H+ antiporter MnhA subunit